MLWLKSFLKIIANATNMKYLKQAHKKKKKLKRSDSKCLISFQTLMYQLENSLIGHWQVTWVYS